MAEIDWSRLRPSAAAEVERHLAVRYRLDDGSRPSETLREMVEGDRFVGKARRLSGKAVIYGFLFTWPGRDEPVFVRVVRPLWDLVQLPIMD